MSPSTVIRRAALGPTPKNDADLTAGWVDFRSEAWKAMRPWADNTGGYFRKLDDTQRRMFLLFVAEAIAPLGEAP